MRLLVLHVDRFAYTVTEPSRSPLREPVEQRTHAVANALVALASVEREDEAEAAATADAAAVELTTLARRLGVTALVLHPFAHLFGEPSTPAMAVEVLDGVKERLLAAGLQVHRSPFGWFTSWDLQAKGHPISRVARIVRAGARGERVSGGGEAL